MFLNETCIVIERKLSNSKSEAQHKLLIWDGGVNGPTQKMKSQVQVFRFGVGGVGAKPSVSKSK